MSYSESEFLQLSGLQHFKFCRRQWALIHIEQQWADNFRTVDGSLMHQNAHDSDFRESRGDLFITRGVGIFSSALESVRLDANVGFLHTDRPGRASLALDLMEELRPCIADRFVLTLINNRMLKPEDFQFQDSGAVLLTDNGRRTFLKAWQEKKRESLTHPFLGEKLAWGMIPYVQALLLARYLRGDLDAYPPFLWK